MKFRKRRSLQVPPKIKSFINDIVAVPFENLEDALKGFNWEYEKGDFYHWVELFNHFDLFFEKQVRFRKDLNIDKDYLLSDPPFPKEAVLQVLRVIRIILDNCPNRHLSITYEHNLSSLLSSTDADVVEASLQTLATFLKKASGKGLIKDPSLNSKLFAFVQGWGGKEEGLGLLACSVEDECDQVAYELGCSLHFEFYAVNDSTNQGLQVIHEPNIITREESDSELLEKLISTYQVPPSYRFSLLTRLRFARAFGCVDARRQYSCMRLQAFIILVQANHEAEDLASFLNNEPEFINDLVSLVSCEEAALERFRILGVLSLTALCQDRLRQTTVLTALTSGGNRGILPSLMQKIIDAISCDSSRWSTVFAEALLTLVTVLVSTSSGCSALREAGFIPTLIPLLKNTAHQHLRLVSTAVHVLESFMDYSNPAATLFRDLGGLDDTIERLMVEVSYVDKGLKRYAEGSQSSNKGKELEVFDTWNNEPIYSETLVSHHQRLLMKSLLRAISLGTYAPGTSARIYGSEESLLPQCLCIIFRKAKDFGGGVFSLAATVMSDLIHKDPTCFPVLDAVGLPSAFLDAILGEALTSSEAITCIPQCLDALCLNNKGLQAVKDQNALRCFVRVFTSKPYLRALTGEVSGSLSTGLDELMRHASSLRSPGVDMLIEILNTLSNIGHGLEFAGLLAAEVSPDPMETDAEDTNLVSSEEGSSTKSEKTDVEDADLVLSEGSSSKLEITVPASEVKVEYYLPDFISNVSRLLETILQNAETCRTFIDKKGVEAILQLFTLPLLPFTVPIGPSVCISFKSFSPQNSPALAKAVCSFLKEHLKSTNELLVLVGGTQLSLLESDKQTEVLRRIFSLESVLYLTNFLLKGSTSIVSELAAAEGDLIKDLGLAYKEILWHISLSCDSKPEEKKDDKEDGIKDESALSTIAASVDEFAIQPQALQQQLRYINNHLSSRDLARQGWPRHGTGREVAHRHSRHGLARVRGGRLGRHVASSSLELEAFTASVNSLIQDSRTKKSPEIMIMENLNKLGFAFRSCFSTLVKGFTSPTRRRADSSLLTPASKILAAAISKIFHEALSFSGHSSSSALEMLSVKCRYLGKIMDDMVVLMFDSRRRACNTVLVNNFYVQGTFKELLMTFEATSQLLWTLPYSISSSAVDIENVAGEGKKLSHSPWLLNTLQSYCRVLEYFVNSSLLLSPTSVTQTQLLVQPAAAGLSLGLFPVPQNPEAFARILQSQVLDVILPVWNNPMFPSCSSVFITSVVSLVNHIYSGVGNVKPGRNGISGSAAARQFLAPPLDEATVTTIVDMGFPRARVEEALRQVATNSVEMAMEWIINHADDPVQEEDELARALALSLGSSSETSKEGNLEKAKEAPVENEEKGTEAPPVDDILASAMKLFQNSDSMAFSLTDLLVTLCNRNKGEDRSRVAVFLIQQLKLCPSDFSKDTSALNTISHVLVLLLAEDGCTREIAADNGVVSAAVDILTSFKVKNETGEEASVPKCVSALLLILDYMLQYRTRSLQEGTEEVPSVSMADSSEELPAPVKENVIVSEANEKEEAQNTFEKTLGKSTGYLTLEECQKVLGVACDFIKQHVPAVVMHAILQLCARLTKTHSLAMQFLDSGGLAAIFGLPRSCFFTGYHILVAAIVRHILEDPQTLQIAMESEIRQTLSGILSRHAGRLAPRTFLTSMASVISRDPVIFMRATASVCQIESSGGRTNIVLSKEKDKVKASVVEIAAPSNEPVRISEAKQLEGVVKCSKNHKKVPANLTQVIDLLLEIITSFPLSKSLEECAGSLILMEVNEITTALKGKSKVDDVKKMEEVVVPEKSATSEKVAFVLKLLSDVLLMYVHAAAVILKRDLETGIINHVLHRLLPLPSDKPAEVGTEWNKLSEKASWFLVVLAGRSGEGRRRVVSEIVRSFSSFSIVENSSSSNVLVPNKEVFAFADLVNSILSKNASASSLPGPGCSPEVARTMIDGGMIQSLSNILEVIDLDHPDAQKVVNLLLKSLECLTRAANASQLAIKSDTVDMKKSVVAHAGRAEGESHVLSDATAVENNVNESSHHEDLDAVQMDQHLEISHNEEDFEANQDQPTTNEGEPTEHEAEFMREEIEEGGVLENSTTVELTFRVERRTDNDGGEEDDEDMGEDGEDDDDDDDEDEEDEDVAEDGTAMMSLGDTSLGDTDVEDHDDNLMGDEYTDDMIDEEDEQNFHENRVIQVRLREGLNGLDQLQVLGRPGGLIDVGAESSFQGINVDDIFGLRVGSERRRNVATRTIPERSALDGHHGSGYQHPLLSRPSSSEDPHASVWSSSFGNSSSNVENLPVGNFDVNQFYMLDAPGHSSTVFSNRLGGAVPPVVDYSLGMDPLHLAGRRGPGDGRWTDGGQSQTSVQAASIAMAVEEQFLSQLRSVLSTNSPTVQRSVENLTPQDHLQADVPQSNSQTEHLDNPTFESASLPESLYSGPDVDVNLQVNMEIGEATLQATPDFVVQSADVQSVDDQSQGGSSVFATLVDPFHEDGPSRTDSQSSNYAHVESLLDTNNVGADVNMDGADTEGNQAEHPMIISDDGVNELSAGQDTLGDQIGTNNEASASSANVIDPTFLEALPEDLRAEVLASQQTRSVQPAAYVPPSAEDIDPEFLAALPPEIQAEVLAQQRAQRVIQSQQTEGQAVDMDNASIIATFPADLREEVLLTSSEAVLSALPSPLLAEAQMLRDRAVSHYQAHSLFGGGHRLSGRRNNLPFDRHTFMDRGVGVTIGRRAVSAISNRLKVNEIEGTPLVDEKALKALVRLLRLAQPLGKGLLQRLLLNLCAHGGTRTVLLQLLLDMIRPEVEGSVSGSATVTQQRLYGCQTNLVYGRPQFFDGLPPLVSRRILEILTYLATNHTAVANILFYFDSLVFSSSSEAITVKGKQKLLEGSALSSPKETHLSDMPLVVFLKLLNKPLFLRSTPHLEQIMGLLQVIIYAAAERVELQSQSGQVAADSKSVPVNEGTDGIEIEPTVAEAETHYDLNEKAGEDASSSTCEKKVKPYDIFMQLPETDLRNICSLLARQGLSDKVYSIAAEILKKLASVVVSHRKFFTSELAELAHGLSSSSVTELVTLRSTHMLGLSAGSMAGASILRVLQALSTLTSEIVDANKVQDNDEEKEEQSILWNLNVALEPLWQELSDCISTTESKLGHNSSSPMENGISGDHIEGTSSLSPALPPGTQQLLPFIEAFFVLCEKLQANHSVIPQDHINVTAREIKESASSSLDISVKCGGAVTFTRFTEKHRRLLNAFIRQNPGLLEKSLSIMLKAPKLIDFDNKRANFRTRIRQQHEHHPSAPLRVSVRRAYVLEDSYNQLRMRSTQDLKGRLTVQFQGEEGIDAGGLTREWYQLLSRVIFDKGALLFTTVGNNATFQPNPNSVYQTEHLSYFKFVGRVVSKALFDGQLLDVHFTRSFYKHILGSKVTYHDIEAVDPDYYKNLKWMLENDVSEIPDLTFSMDADEEKHILYEKTEVTDFELIPGGRNIRVTEETKHEYVDLVAEHIFTNAIRPQINAFLEGFIELVPRELISIFNDKELELLISGLPEIDLDDLKANTEYTGFTPATSVIQWFWEVVKAFSKEDKARLLQFVTGTSKVPLEGFKALQGISGGQRFQIHKAYGAPERLPSAHTCFNQLDLPEYTSKEQLQERLLLAIHEGSEGFGFG